ncbi:DnaJ domain-containing protein [Aureimonas mangrovi]|uniref:DnaJ domain-containing protein n=1 Tax=Aureimonas mangrovi TaxID=2758041 RepID=UPI00163D860A|nr:DnaJ domain-containing protein [Aureimonas mangrovi]
MTFLLVVAGVVFLVATLRLLLVTPPEKLATFLRTAGPAAVIAAGAGLTLTGRGAIGLPLAAFGMAALRRGWNARPVPIGGGRPPTTVRSRFLEMTLDHDSGDLDGVVLGGQMEGARLSALRETDLRTLQRELAADTESLRLLEAYLDRRLPGWRDDAKARAGDGLGRTPGSGSMTQQEAHEILGLEPGATLAEIREAHRRLMKGVHPDRGGSALLAARINEAKAFLVERHR